MIEFENENEEMSDLNTDANITTTFSVKTYGKAKECFRISNHSQFDTSLST